MNGIATTPKPPYFAVIFTSITSADTKGYAEMSDTMVSLAQQQPGYLGMESAREALGITVSYWDNLESIRLWKQQLDHQQAQALGRAQWYSRYQVRISKVERDYHFENGSVDEQHGDRLSVLF